MPDTRLHDLISLAQEPSSERRRELLRGVTDVFFDDAPYGANETGLFDDILSRLAGEMEEAVRAELASRMAGFEHAPSRLISSLAGDESIAVAGPVLQNAASLSADDQIRIIRTRSQEHIRALTRRATVASEVSDAIVEHGDDQALGELLRNDGAELSRSAQEAAVDRAQANPDLHAAVVERKNLSPDLLNEMYFVVEARLRDRILEKNSEIDPETLEAALQAGRNQLAARDGALPADYDAAEAYVAGLRKERGGLGPQQIAAMLRNKQTTRFLVALASLADIDFHTARRILEKKELDALAIVCKAAGFDRALFLTFVMLILDRESTAMAKARQYGVLFEDLPRDAAMRTVRFWRMRRQTAYEVAA